MNTFVEKLEDAVYITDWYMCSSCVVQTQVYKTASTRKKIVTGSGKERVFWEDTADYFDLSENPIFKSNKAERFHVERLENKQRLILHYELLHRRYDAEDIESGLHTITEAISRISGVVDFDMCFRNYIKMRTFESSHGTSKCYYLRNNSLGFSYKLEGSLSDCFYEIYDVDISNISQVIKTIMHEISLDKKFSHARKIENGKYLCVLSPEAAGLFVHECLGHFFEADYYCRHVSPYLPIGTQVGEKWLNVVDYGKIIGSGYTPFDDEGTDAQKTLIIKEGKINALLTDLKYANLLGLNFSSGNSRARYASDENLIRMTTTYMAGGNISKEEIISSIESGIYIETCKGAILGKTFHIYPRRAYLIQHGKITEPVLVSDISGEVIEAIRNITAISNDVKLFSSIFGGCTKKNQKGLHVAYGGPHVVIQSMDVT